MVSQCTKFEDSRVTRYEAMIGGAKGVVRGHSRSWAMPPFDRAHTTSYLTLIETMCLSFIVFETQPVICRKSPILTHSTCILSFNFTLMTMHFPSHGIFWNCNLPSHVECFQYNNRLHMTVCFINFSRHSIIVDRAHGTGLIILTQNSSHCEILLLIFNAQQTSSDNG